MINLLLVLCVALLGRILSEKLNQPVVIGELLLGVVLGNLALAQMTEPLELISQLGILILIFSSGLTLDFDEMRRLGKKTFSISTIEVTVSFTLGYLLGQFAGFSHLNSLFIGTIMVATSIGITAEILGGMKMLRTKLGTMIIGLAVSDDVYGILILGVVTGIAVTGTVHLTELILMLLLIFIFFSLSLSIVRKVVIRLSRRFNWRPENLLLFGILSLLVYGLIAKEIGLELVVGSFLAGVILGQSYYSRDLLENISLFGESFFIPVFFVTAGMGLQLGNLLSLQTFVFTLIFTLIALVGKLIGCGLGALLSGFRKNEALAIGISMLPRGEVALIIAHIGLAYGMSGSIYSAVVILILISSIMSPVLLTRQLKKLKS